MRTLLLVLAAVLQLASAQSPTKTAAGAVPPAQHKHANGFLSSHFSAFTKSLDQTKRKPFMELMKKLRDAKKVTGTKEDKKKSTTTIDADIHKLLGTEYKRYRAVHAAVNAVHAAKKAGGMPPPPPPPIMTSTKLPGAKKKKAAGSKKVTTGSTTIG